MANWLKRTLIVVAILVIAAFLAVQTAWLLARPKVTELRSTLASAPPLPPIVASAIVASEDPAVLQRPGFSLRAFVPPSDRVAYCGPRSMAYILTTQGLSGPPSLRTHTITYVVSRAFTPEELLRIYGHTIYLGTIDKRPVLGVTAASDVYFAKAPHELTAAEAATLAAMIRSPNVFSPVRFPERNRERRDRVLERMLRFGYIGREEYERAVRTRA